MKLERRGQGCMHARRWQWALRTFQPRAVTTINVDWLQLEIGDPGSGDAPDGEWDRTRLRIIGLHLIVSHRLWVSLLLLLLPVSARYEHDRPIAAGRPRGQHLDLGLFQSH